jgi:hypothetical protein
LEPRRLMSYDFHALLDPAFHCNADPDAASKNNADPSGSETLIRSVKLTGTWRELVLGRCGRLGGRGGPGSPAAVLANIAQAPVLALQVTRPVLTAVLASCTCKLLCEFKSYRYSCKRIGN